MEAQLRVTKEMKEVPLNCMAAMKYQEENLKQQIASRDSFVN